MMGKGAQSDLVLTGQEIKNILPLGAFTEGKQRNHE